MKVLKFPLARITIAFVIGTLLAYFTKPILLIVFISLGSSAAIFVGSYYSSQSNKKFHLFFEIVTYLLSFTIGITTQTFHTEFNQANNYTHYKNIYDQKHTFTLTLRENLKPTAFNERYIALVNSIDETKASGRILLNIRKDSLTHSFNIGDQLKINTLLNKNTPQKNPNQFDYQKYLENKQIYAQLYVDPSEIQINTHPIKDIWYYTAQLRSRIIQNLKKSNFSNQELNVAVALILGQQQDIDPEIIQDYQYAGAVHILSVSGLHIGFILLFINLLLKPFPNTKKGALVKLFISLTALFLFGILAGLAPSVVRSIVMFSFVAIGNYLRRGVNIYHTLLVSMLLILLFQPSFLFDVGFQLSYIALFFIVWLQPLLANSWKPKNQILNYFWDILTVSFAAQIGTLPLSIYYFHQFPGLFFITNIIVIPFINIIMAVGCLVMVFAAFNWVPYYPAKILEVSISYLDTIIHRIASLEQFIITNIPLNFFLLISGYLALITIIAWLQQKRFKNLVFVFASIIILQLTAITTKWKIQNQSEFIVLNTPKSTNLLERKGSQTILYSNDSILKNTQSNKVLASYLTANFSTLKEKHKLKNLLYFKGSKILVIDGSKVYPKNEQPDILILTQSPKLNFDRLLQSLQPKIVVADASNYQSILTKWQTTCSQQKIPFHATREKGFYRVN